MFNWLYPLIAGLVLACYGLLFGAIVGALMGLAMYAMQAGRRDFRAATSLRPKQFDIVADVDVADQALQLLHADANQPR